MTVHASSLIEFVKWVNGMVRGKQSDGLFGGFISTKLHPGD